MSAPDKRAEERVLLANPHKGAEMETKSSKSMDYGGIGVRASFSVFLHELYFYFGKIVFWALFNCFQFVAVFY